jgi:hypothetical protein
MSPIKNICMGKRNRSAVAGFPRKATRSRAAPMLAGNIASSKTIRHAPATAPQLGQQPSRGPQKFQHSSWVNNPPRPRKDLGHNVLYIMLQAGEVCAAGHPKQHCERVIRRSLPGGQRPNSEPSNYAKYDPRNQPHNQNRHRQHPPHPEPPTSLRRVTI